MCSQISMSKFPILYCNVSSPSSATSCLETLYGVSKSVSIDLTLVYNYCNTKIDIDKCGVYIEL